MESPLNQRLRRSPPDVVYTPIDVTSTSEDGAFWLAFLRSLMARGLSGVQLVTSDAHQWLKDETLEELGYEPWLDDDAVPAGTLRERGLLQGMQASCAVVFFVTPSFKD